MNSECFWKFVELLFLWLIGVEALKYPWFHGIEGTWTILERGVYLQETIFFQPFLDKFGSKNQNCLFKMKFDI